MEAALDQSKAELTAAPAMLGSFGAAEIEVLVPIITIVLFTLLAYVIKLYAYDIPAAQQESAGKKARLQEGLSDIAQGKIAEMMSRLVELNTCSSLIAERHFQDKYRNMKHCLNTVLESKWTLEESEGFGAIRVDRFRQGIVGWLKAFEGCSLDPENSPTVLCPSKQFLQAKTVPDICRAVLEESEGKMCSFDRTKDAAHLVQQKVSKAIRRLSDGENRPARLKFTCTSIAWERHSKGALPASVHLLFVKFTIFGVWDGALLLLLLKGVGLAIALHAWGQHFLGAGVDVSIFLLLLVLARVADISEIARLDQELEELKANKLELDDVADTVHGWGDKYDQVANLWEHHTAIILEICDEQFRLCQTMMDRKDERHEELERINELVEQVVDGMGPLSLYMGDDAIHDDWLRLVSEEMKESLRKIGEAVDKADLPEVARLYESFCCFLAVDVVGAEDLDVSPEASSYVIGKFRPSSEKSIGEIRTTALGGKNPDWDQEFLVKVPIDATSMKFEVLEGGEQRKSIMERLRQIASPFQHTTHHEHIGNVKFLFRTCPGNWLKQKLPLHGGHTSQAFYGSGSQALHGSAHLEVHFFYGTSVVHLASVTKKDSGESIRNLDSWLTKL